MARHVFDPVTGEAIETNAECQQCAQVADMAEAMAEDLRLAESEVRKLRRDVGRLKSEAEERRRLHKMRPQVQEIFEHWVVATRRNPKRTKLGEKREKAVLARLEDGYEVEAIKQAVENFARDCYRDEKTGKRYDDLELLCRNEVQLERYLPSETPDVGRPG